MGVKPGYKQTEVGVLPVEWATPLLGDCCALITKGTTPTSLGRNFTRAGVRFLKAESISDSGRSIPDKTAFIDEETHALLKRSQLAPGDLLISIAGVLGRIGLVDQADLPGNTNQALAIIRLGKQPELDRNFLFYTLRSPAVEKQIRDINVQAAQANISLQNVREFRLSVPPLPEQRAIAEALSDVDGLLGGLDRLIAKKHDLKQAAMQQLLTGHTRLPGFHGEWEVKRLGDVLKVRHGKSQHSIIAPDGRYPILASGGEIGRTNAFIYDQPSVLIGRKGTIDAPQFVDSPFWTVDTLFFTEISNNAHPKFVYYKFTMIRWRSYNEASGVPSLNAKTIESIEVAMPSLPEQVAIAEVLTDMDAELAALEQRREKTAALKQAMMQVLLTGRVRLV